MSNLTAKEMLPCFWITCHSRTFVLKPDEVESMKRSMAEAGYSVDQYKIDEGLISATDLSRELTRRDIAMISNLL